MGGNAIDDAPDWPMPPQYADRTLAEKPWRTTDSATHPREEQYRAMPAFFPKWLNDSPSLDK